jgi:hypothetical protein
MTNVLLYLSVWLNGAAVGALVAAVVLWWSLATGRRTMKARI